MRKILFTAILLAIAALAFMAGSRYGHDQVNGPVRAERQVLYYTDPMNPGFRSEQPGMAPCGMPLEPVYAELGNAQGAVALGAPPPPPGTVTISTARQQMIGVQVRPVVLEPMTSTLRLYGKIVPDEAKVYRVNTSADSWVRKLSAITTGSMVSKDQILAEVLAPNFYTVQVAYLAALNNLDRYRDRFGDNLGQGQVDFADNQMRTALEDIENLGVTPAQIKELATSRKVLPLLQVRSPVDGVVLSRNLSLDQWVPAGEEFYRIADIGTVWVYADVYEEEARYLRPGMEVKVRHDQTGANLAATVGQVLPLFDPLTKTLKVRLDVANPRYDLRPDMFVDVEIPITLPPSLHVPADAIVDTGTMQVVYVDTGNSTFEPRRVETGWRLGRQVEITGGLMAGEKVVIGGNFLIDSESRMKTAAAGMHGPTSKDPVCGMYVDEEAAKMAGNIGAHADRTYYFCKTQCREAFTKEPEKFVHKLEGGREAEHAAMQAGERSWREMLAPGKELSGGTASEMLPKDADDAPDPQPLPEETSEHEAADMLPGEQNDLSPAKPETIPAAESRPAEPVLPAAAAEQPSVHRHEAMRELPVASKPLQPAGR
ncbi:MAG: efflux RND transporter periplasmic adaptor subunit [Desulfobulbaceae bacterium]